MRKFGELKVHENNKHLIWPHTFNPYDSRRATHHLYDPLFRQMCNTFPHTCDFVFDHFFTGCLDAPDQIPMGSTERIHTVGGFEREEYRNLSRGTDDWKAVARAEYETAQYLKELLEDCK